MRYHGTKIACIAVNWGYSFGWYNIVGRVLLSQIRFDRTLLQALSALFYARIPLIYSVPYIFSLIFVFVLHSRGNRGNLKHDVLCLDPRFNKSNTLFCKHKKVLPHFAFTNYQAIPEYVSQFGFFKFYIKSSQRLFVKPGHKTRLLCKRWSILKGAHQVLCF